MHRLLLFIGLVTIAALVLSQSALAGVLYIELGDQNVVIDYAGDIDGHRYASATAGEYIRDFETVTTEDSASVEFGSIASARADTQNAIVFRAYAHATSRYSLVAGFGVASADASSDGGEVIGMDLRSFEGPIPSELTAYLVLDGFLSVHSDTPEGGFRALANVLWSVRDLDGVGGGIGFGGSFDTIVPEQDDFVLVDELISVPLSISFRWLLSDGTTTLEDLGRRPDFGIVGFAESLTVQAWSLRDANATASFFNSAKLTAVLLPDGSTPENNGIDLYFLSGRSSPNLPSVPEPSSIIIFSVCTLGYGIATALRSRMRAA
jgi:hypothetical protein